MTHPRGLALTLFLTLAGTSAWAESGTAACGMFPVGQAEYTCTCLGTEDGPVWGSGPYTADSALCVAARHAGAVGAGGGTIRALAQPGQQMYAASTQNGVSTADWGPYDNSFSIVPAQSAAACGMFPSGAAEHRCSCTGAESGSVWGSGPYTSDSDICVAARHAGVIGRTGGEVVAFGGAGLAAYPSSTNNDVTTSEWGEYHSSFDFGPIPMPAPSK